MSYIFFINVFLLTTVFIIPCSVLRADTVSLEPEIPAEKQIYRIPRVNSHIKVDAVLDEKFWQEAVVIEANIEVRPAENVPASVNTEALMAYDETNLYVAFRCYDPEPEKIRAHLCDRDNIGNDDWILILFDTFNDQRRSYDFMCNPYGIQSDFIETNGGNGSSWDAIWYSDGRITDFGYVVEMAIPFSSLSFQHAEGDQVWSFDVVRSYPRNVRHHIGAFPRDRNNNCYLCQAPKLIGFAGVEPGKNIEIDPTFSAGYSQEREELDDGGYGSMKESSQRYDPGVSANWNVTPNMTLSATINPDFSQVEADAAQMDINRKFPLYYSEKRPFFTEGADMYNAYWFVHTRTLADPDWGIKLTGKSGRNTIGFFTVSDTFTPLNFPEAESCDNTTLSLQSQGTLFRYKRDIFESSTVGMLFTDREGTDYYNRLAVLDAELRPTKTDIFNIMVSGSTTRYPSEVADEFDQKTGGFEGGAYYLEYFHNTENYYVGINHRALDPGLRSDIGYTTQVDYRRNQVGGEYRWRSDGDNWYNYISINGGHMYLTDYDNNPLENTFFSLTPNSSTSLNIWAVIGDQIDYTNNRPGSKFAIGPSIEQKIGDRLKLKFEHRYENLKVDVGRLYTANVSNARVEYQFTKRCFLRLILQHVQYNRVVSHYIEEEREDVDPETRKVFSQALFSYKINPRTVFFLGYSDNYQNRNEEFNGRIRDDNLIQENRAIFTKIGYAWQM